MFKRRTEEKSPKKTRKAGHRDGKESGMMLFHLFFCLREEMLHCYFKDLQTA